jgi:WD40 repeat protein
VWVGHEGFVYSVATHPDGEHVVSAAWDKTVRVWDTAGREVRRFHDPNNDGVAGVAVSPDGKRVATVSCGDAVRVWEFATGELLHTWVRPRQHWKTGRVAFHPTADLLAGCGGNKSVLVVNPVTGETVIELPTASDAVRDVTFSPDGKWLAAGGCGDMTVHVWEVGAWRKVATLTASKDSCYSLAFSPDGLTLACGSVDGNVYLWDAPTWAPQAPLPHGVKVYGLAFTPDGKRLACGCADNTVRLWDTARREQVAELRGHTDYVHSLVFSRNGHRLVTASGDMTLRTWDAPPPK